ncbi:PilZ domain-containing protein [Pontixanthobacter aestiaquae]|uniref:PilZ domain-containing protein n=1 Tax=Pontixanthobacter aestiaquae TaxID=1509367 RepID=A0A844Z402_9SPHN|nr:PilZ domain-containing protein [Pontixanthobacter aestiaquae]MDN3646784.1 PilZ domain-containing protein [Pontixanthobacter aestiaquae]MXO82234.1 PilZ domain-containing protein [Pontixanthobacter aestiaquae]
MKSSPEMPQGPEMSIDVEPRAAPRFTLLIRTAKLIIDDQQFLCVVRDISATGFSIRSFHPINKCDRIAIELQSGDCYPASMVWQRDGEAGFEFHTPIEVDAIVMGLSDYPKRDLRFDLKLPVTLQAHGMRLKANLANLSRQGGNVHCSSKLSIDQLIRIEAPGMPEIEARVRWRKDGVYGLVFDTTFSLANLALLIRDLNLRSKLGSKIARACPPPTAGAIGQ